MDYFKSHLLRALASRSLSLSLSLFFSIWILSFLTIPDWRRDLDFLKYHFFHTKFLGNFIQIHFVKSKICILKDQWRNCQVNRKKAINCKKQTQRGQSSPVQRGPRRKMLADISSSSSCSLLSELWILIPDPTHPRCPLAITGHAVRIHLLLWSDRPSRARVTTIAT